MAPKAKTTRPSLIVAAIDVRASRYRRTALRLDALLAAVDRVDANHCTTDRHTGLLLRA